MPTHANAGRLVAHSPTRRSVIGLLLAHQGGWDEFLLVLVPIGVIAGLLGVARHRTRQ